MILLFSVNVSAGDYDFEKSEGSGDVEDLINGGTTSEYPNVDITNAKIEESGNDLIFTLDVNGVIEDSEKIRYIFTVKSVDDETNYKGVWYTNGNGYLYKDSIELDLNPVVENGKLTVSVPTASLSDVSLDWEVTVKAEIQGKFKDEVILEAPSGGDGDGDGDTGDGDGNGDGDGDVDTGDGNTPGFELLAILSAFAIFIIARKKFK